ncbi:MAG: hypothetical protein [Bacteriophage sp.]|nr:MAG: hypothetical protein [Bacteriophage sp.]
MRKDKIQVFVNVLLDRTYEVGHGVWEVIQNDYNLDTGYYIDLWAGDEIHEHGKIIQTKIVPSE